ncbi:unnamed protein product [Echinostoma caproni]|uniref:WD_REPEATS_REGION domain-containing protein n=1 Tax=Echinostoma caproni TaxID=27848 RepID=A0A183A5B0_9TREM|nr:unnamed protein product [Echinostoma caproni]
MPVEVMCTATCLTRTSEHVIVARTTPTGPSILVWNLTSNQTEHEIPYHPMNPLVKDSVTYLNISMDDRLVVAGFQNPTDDHACYMVFDLAAHYRVSELDPRDALNACSNKQKSFTNTYHDLNYNLECVAPLHSE